MDVNDVGKLLSGFKTVAVVGLSDDPGKPSFQVGKYLQSHGFRVVPVNPFVEEVLGEKSYKSLLEIPLKLQKELEIVDVFRRSEAVPSVVDQAIKLRRKNGKPEVIWMQEGVVHEEAAKRAKEAGFRVIMDRCIMKDHRKL